MGRMGRMGRMDDLTRAATSFSAAFHLFKVVAWTAFALLGPGVFLVMRNFVGVAVLSGISVLIALFIFRPGVFAFELRASLRAFLLLQGVVLGAYAAHRLTAAAPGWTREIESAGMALHLAPDGRLRGVELSERARVLERDPATQTWSSQGFPAGVSHALAVDEASSTLVVADARRSVLWFGAVGAAPGDAGGGAGGEAPADAFRSVATRRPPSGFVPTASGLLVTGGGQLARLASRSGHLEPLALDGTVTVACAAGSRVLVVESERVRGAGRAWESLDGAASFTPISSFRGNGSLCALAADGWAWVADGGLLTGDLAVRAPGQSFVVLDAPLSRIEAVVVRPTDGREAFVAGWGGGVFRTRDGGSSWEHLGLDGFEVGALAVDFERGRLFAATGSGVHVRPLPP